MTWARWNPRDRRALIVAALVVLPVLLYRVAVSPYMQVLSDIHDRVEVQRELLRRELTVLEEAPAYPVLTRDAAAALSVEAPRLFSGPDELAASAALINYVSVESRRHRVLIQQSETRRAQPTGEGVLTLEITVRGMSDLEGLLGFLEALDGGPRLVRVEQIAIRRAQLVRIGTARDEEILNFNAVISGYALVGADGAVQAVDLTGAGGRP